MWEIFAVCDSREDERWACARRVAHVSRKKDQAESIGKPVDHTCTRTLRELSRAHPLTRRLIASTTRDNISAPARHLAQCSASENARTRRIISRSVAFLRYFQRPGKRTTSSICRSTRSSSPPLRCSPPPPRRKARARPIDASDSPEVHAMTPARSTASPSARGRRWPRSSVCVAR